MMSLRKTDERECWRRPKTLVDMEACISIITHGLIGRQDRLFRRPRRHENLRRAQLLRSCRRDRADRAKHAGCFFRPSYRCKSSERDPGVASRRRPNQSRQNRDACQSRERGSSAGNPGSQSVASRRARPSVPIRDGHGFVGPAGFRVLTRPFAWPRDGCDAKPRRSGGAHRPESGESGRHEGGGEEAGGNGRARRGRHRRAPRQSRGRFIRWARARMFCR